MTKNTDKKQDASTAGKDTKNSTEKTQASEATLQMPAPTFTTFALSLASSALVQLGEVPDPESGKVQANILLAKHSIDTLSMLQDKVTNGLSKEEQELMNGLLYELRMKYVVLNKK